MKSKSNRGSVIALFALALVVMLVYTLVQVVNLGGDTENEKLVNISNEIHATEAPVVKVTAEPTKVPATEAPVEEKEYIATYNGVQMTKKDVFNEIMRLSADPAVFMEAAINDKQQLYVNTSGEIMLFKDGAKWPSRVALNQVELQVSVVRTETSEPEYKAASSKECKISFCEECDSLNWITYRVGDPVVKTLNEAEVNMLRRSAIWWIDDENELHFGFRVCVCYSSNPTVSEAPTATPKPTEAPTATPKPTEAPTATPKPTEAPTATPKPTEAPTATPKPTEVPTPTPTVEVVLPPDPTPTVEVVLPTEAPTATPKPTPSHNPDDEGEEPEVTTAPDEDQDDLGGGFDFDFGGDPDHNPDDDTGSEGNDNEGAHNPDEGEDEIILPPDDDGGDSEIILPPDEGGNDSEIVLPIDEGGNDEDIVLSGDDAEEEEPIGYIDEDGSIVIYLPGDDADDDSDSGSHNDDSDESDEGSDDWIFLPDD